MELNQIVRIDMLQEYNNQAIVNTFFYRQTTSPSTALIDLLNAFKTLVVDVVRTIQSAFVFYRALKAVNLFDTAEIAELPLTVVGARSSTAGESMPPYVAYGYILRRSTGATRNGFKRFVGVLESDVGYNGFTVPTGANNAIQNALAQDLVWNIVNTARPVILGRTPTGGYDLSRWSYVAAAQIRNVTTQNTRKVGRGS